MTKKIAKRLAEIGRFPPVFRILKAHKQRGSSMIRAFRLVAALGAGTAILIGIFLSPIPTNLGFYRFVASKLPHYTGLTPAFHHGVEWQYTFDDLQHACPQLKGQTAVITGANSGLGYETARVLAKCGVHVTMACRNPKKCSAAADKIREESRDAEVDTMIVDTSSLQSVQKFSKEFLTKHEDGALDMLYLNAGIGFGTTNSPTELALSEDGIELIFATNYVGHHLMYRQLEPLLLKSKMARVVQISSDSSFRTFDEKVATSIDVLNQPRSDPRDLRYYGQSKLAQVVWVKHLTKRLGEDSNIYVNAAHPGCVDTLIWDKSPAVLGPIMPLINYLRKRAMWTMEEGALTPLYLGVATKELSTKNIRGKYFHPQAQEVVNPFSLDENLQEDLWEFSDSLVSKFL